MLGMRIISNAICVYFSQYVRYFFFKWTKREEKECERERVGKIISSFFILENSIQWTEIIITKI